MNWIITENNKRIDALKIPTISIEQLKTDLRELKLRVMGFFGKQEFSNIRLYVVLADDKNAKAATCILDCVTGISKSEGAYCENVCGTYVHGVFDKEAVAEAIVRILGRKKGIDVSELTGVDFASFKETQYDILADELRKHLDMKMIYRILEEGLEDED